MINTKTYRRACALAVFVLGLAIAGPGVRVAGAQPIPCPGASCDVVVTVSGGTVSANDLQMGRGNKAVIVWKLQSPDYRFQADSIRPHTGAPSGTKQTTTQVAWDAQMTQLPLSDDTYRMRNNNGKKETLFYDIKVYPKSGGAPLVLDPRIINDP